MVLLNFLQYTRDHASILLLLVFVLIGACNENPVESTPTSGRVAFWSDVSNQGDIAIKLDGHLVGSLTSSLSSVPSCGQSGTLTISKPPGTYEFSAESGSGGTWAGVVTVESDACLTMRLRPSNPPDPDPDPDPQDGRIAFWSNIGNEGNIEIWIDGLYAGALTHYFTNRPACGASGTLTLNIGAGDHYYSARSAYGTSWNGTFAIVANQCFTYLLYR